MEWAGGGFPMQDLPSCMLKVEELLDALTHAQDRKLPLLMPIFSALLARRQCTVDKDPRELDSVVALIVTCCDALSKPLPLSETE